MRSEQKAGLRNTSVIPLLAGDLLVILLFVFIGERDHAIADPQPLLRLIVTAAEFAVPWVIASWLLGSYQQGLTARELLGRSANAWLIAAPLGALVRSFANGSGVIVSLFLVVALFAGGAMVIAWRLVWAWLSRRWYTTASL